MRITATSPSIVLCSTVLVLAFLFPAMAYAQTIATFQHIVIVVQENRTPDNLFGSGPARTPCNAEDPFEPGVDIENCGYAYTGKTVYLTPRHLNDSPNGLNPGRSL